MTKNQTQVQLTTKLAFERTRLAYDRTTMSWIRTAISLITFGFAEYKFFQLELAGGVVDPRRVVGPREFAIILVAIGLISLFLGTLEHWQGMRRLKADWPEMPRSRTGFLSGFIWLLGILALIVVILRR
jgi:putative membrane protein